MKRVFTIVSGVVLSIIALVAVDARLSASSTAAASGATEIKIDNFSFTPATITIKAGTEVRWINRDDIPHTVVADDKSFKSKALDTDEQFSFTFAKPGTYNYFCSIHPKMTAKIVVQ